MDTQPSQQNQTTENYPLPARQILGDGGSEPAGQVEGQKPKKVIVTAIIILALLAFGAGAYWYFTEFTSDPVFFLISPNGGEKWIKGKTYTIKWELTGRASLGIWEDAGVNIELFDGKNNFSQKIDNSTFIKSIVNSVPGRIEIMATEEKYKWTVPNDIPEGKYLLRINMVANVRDFAPINSSWDDFSDEAFDITEP